MKFASSPLAAAMLAALSAPVSSSVCAQQLLAEAPIKTLGTITVLGNQPTSLPTQIPTTIEGMTREQIETHINAFDSEDALKYFPSLNVRKRYIGDYDHAVLASRASGTGNSARSLVYADGILLSNLLGNGASYTPRWGLVTPEEIERVDVLYGPFSAAYSGNSVGAVVDYVTRMPKQFEAHLKASYFSQPFKQYGTDDTYNGHEVSASIGDKFDNWTAWVNVSRLDSTGQPIAFANKLLSAGTVSATGVSVTGAIADKNPSNADWYILGSTNSIHTVQDHLKAKLAYDFSPTLRASYTLGVWRNNTERSSVSYLRDAAGNPVYSGDVNNRVNINGRLFALTASDFAPNRSQLEHFIHGFSLKSNTQGVFDWEAAASIYDYSKDLARSPNLALPAANDGGAGRLTDMKGTGWTTLSLRGTWRPDGLASNQLGTQVFDFGYQRDVYRLRTLVSDTSDWISGLATTRFSAFNGNTKLESLYAQDTWRFAPDWKTTLGGRWEQWSAYGGEIANASSTLGFGARKETAFSPKAAIAWQTTPDWALKASLGRAVRNPTVAELYQGSITANVITNNDPNLKAEKSWTSELTAERDLMDLGLAGSVRATLFHENTKDALYSQTNVTVTPNVTNIQNIDQIRTTGMELAASASNVAIRGLDLSTSLTYANSRTVKNDKFPASVGKWQPRVPQWRSTFMVSYQPDEQWAYTLGARYSSRQYGTLDNSDPNGFTYTGVSSYFVADVRVRYRFTKQWVASVGIDNLNNKKYWAFHPYTQRTYAAEVKYDY